MESRKHSQYNDAIEMTLATPAELGQRIELSRQDKELFHRTVRNTIALVNYLQKKCKDKIPLIMRLILHDQAEFDRLINKTLDFTYVAKHMPDYADELMQFVLAHPDVFERLIKSDQELKSVSAIFPKYQSLFAGQTAKEMLSVISQNVEAIQIGLLNLVQAQLPLPDEVLIVIASHFSDHPMYTRETKLTIAKSAKVNNQ